MSKTILSEVDQVIANVFRPSYNMVAYSLVLVCITALLIWINPVLAMLAAGVLGSLYAIIFVGIKKLTQLGGVSVESNKERFMAAGEAIGGIKDIKLLGREASYLSRFRGHSEQFASTVATQQTLNQVPKFAIEAVAFGGIIAIVLVLMVGAGGISGGGLGSILPIVGLYAFAAYRLQPALQAIFQGVASLRYGQKAVSNLYADAFPDVVPLHLPDRSPVALKFSQAIGLEKLS
jgi:ABC-type bacteriocin/lantibiotic exporter with double-glycine peptidase domain